MRHRVAGRVLNADTQHRLAIRRNLARSLFLHGRVVTTLAKAKAVRRFAEKLITRAKAALVAKAAGKTALFVHEVRVLARDVPDRVILRKLLADVAAAARDRPGGYTRIVRDWKNQVGDNAPRAIFELVDRPAAAPEAPEGEAAAAESGGKGPKKAGGEAGAAKKAKTPAKKTKTPAKAKAGAAKGGDGDE